MTDSNLIRKITSSFLKCYPNYYKKGVNAHLENGVFETSGSSSEFEEPTLQTRLSPKHNNGSNMKTRGSDDALNFMTSQEHPQMPGLEIKEEGTPAAEMGNIVENDQTTFEPPKCSVAHPENDKVPEIEVGQVFESEEQFMAAFSTYCKNNFTHFSVRSSKRNDEKFRAQHPRKFLHLVCKHFGTPRRLQGKVNQTKTKVCGKELHFSV